LTTLLRLLRLATQVVLLGGLKNGRLIWHSEWVGGGPTLELSERLLRLGNRTCWSRGGAVEPQSPLSLVKQ